MVAALSGRCCARSAFGALLVALLLSATPDAGWKVIETQEFEWDADGKPEKFIVEEQENADVEGSARVRVLKDGVDWFLLEIPDPWYPIKEAITRWSRIQPARNLVSSKYLLFLPFPDDSGKPPLLFLFGWQYASSPGSMHVIALDRGSPRVVFFQENFDFIDYVDLDKDGFREIVGKPCWMQPWGRGFETYAPFHVYKLPRGGGGAELSMPLSEEYNLKHYYGWAGPDCSEDHAVVKNPPGGGRPVIMKAKDAEKLFKTSPPEPE